MPTTMPSPNPSLMQVLPFLASGLGALIGGLIGFLSAWLMWRKGLRLQRRNVAQGLSLEISHLERTLKQFVEAFESPPPGEGLLAVDSAIYPNHGLYYALQKDLLSFDAELARALFTFYMDLLEIEKIREIRPDSPFFPVAAEALGSLCSKSYKQIPQLKRLLSREL